MCRAAGQAAQDDPHRRDAVHPASTAIPLVSPTPSFPYGSGGDAVVAASVGVLSVLCACVLVTVVMVLAVRVWRRLRKRRRTNVYDEVASVNGSLSRCSTMQLISTHHSPARHHTEWPTQRTPIPHLSPPPPPPSPSPAPAPLVLTATHLPLQPPPSTLPESPFSHDYSEVFPAPFPASRHPPPPPFTPCSPIYDEVTVDPYSLGARHGYEDHLYCSVADLPEVAEEVCAESVACQCCQSAVCDGHTRPGLGSKERECVDCLEREEAGQRWNGECCHAQPAGRTPNSSGSSASSAGGYTLPAVSSIGAGPPSGSGTEHELTDSERPQRVDPYRVSVIAPSWSTPKKETFSKCPSLAEEPGDASCGGLAEPAGYNHLEEAAPKKRDSRQYATLEPHLSPVLECSH